MNDMENYFPFVGAFLFLWKGKMINTSDILAIKNTRVLHTAIAIANLLPHMSYCYIKSGFFKSYIPYIVIILNLEMIEPNPSLLLHGYSRKR